MPISDDVSAIAKSALGCSADDPAGLIELRDRLTSFAERPDVHASEHALALVTEAAGKLERLIFREEQDESAALSAVHRAIDQLQDLADALGSGVSPDDAARATGLEPACDVDPELLEAWVSSAAETMTEVEAAVLSMISGTAPADAVAEVRRRIHTVKGECGVVSAHDAQRVFHEAESAIDRAQAAGLPFPTDEILALVDWMRRSLETVDASSASAIAADQDLLARITAVAPEPAPPSPTTPVAVQAPSHVGPSKAAPSTAAPTHPAPTQPASTEPAPASAAPTRAAPAAGLVEMIVEVDDTVREFISESREHFAAAEQALLELESDPGNTELVNTVFRAFHTIKGVAGFLNLRPIVEMAHKAEFLLDAVRSGTIAVTSPLLDLVLNANDMLASLIGMIEDGPAPTRAAFDDLLERLDEALRGGAPRPLESRQVVAAARADDEPAAEGVEPEDDAAAPEPAKGVKRRQDQTIKVNTHRLDALVDMVGELVIGQQMVVQDRNVLTISDQRTQRNLQHVGKIIRDLQEVAMSLRMVTLRGTFQKMTRLVRDLSAKAGKQIQLHIEGEDTELDRNVVDEIGDPLVHMIRNACDHGIEPPAERRAAGKTDAGTLTLRAYHKGGAIIIEVQDDGRGLHRDKILKKAIVQGLIPADRDPSDLSDHEVHQLIFAPGFSTAEKVTDVSGRGVGMDVVKRNLQALRGKVEIRSVPGQGSTFLLSLPLTMAIIDGMVVRVGPQRYVIPTLSIEQSFRPKPGEVKTVMERGEVVMVRGSLLPIYRLRRLFRLDAGSDNLDETLLVVLESNGSRCCLQVDELLGQQQVVIKSLGQGVGSLRGVSGGAILGDGRVAPILDVAGLFAQAAESIPAAA